MMPRVGDRIRFKETWLKEFPEDIREIGKHVFKVIALNERMFCFGLIGTEKRWWDNLGNFNRTFSFVLDKKIRYVRKRRTSSFKPR